MKSHLYKAALLVALGLAGASVAQAQNYTSGDLLAGFTTGSGTDLIYDLGQESALYNGETWTSLQTLLNSDYSGSLTTLSWGVIGNGPASGSPRTLWSTTAQYTRAGTVHGSQAFNQINNATGALANNFSGASALGSSATVPATGPSDSTSWNVETTSAATVPTDYINVYENPNVTGLAVADLSAINNDGSTPTVQGNFALGSDGSLTFTQAVPEPTTFGLLGGGALLLLAFRNKLSRKQV